MSKNRKPVVQDPAVAAALKALKDAILAVNGDAQIVGMITLAKVWNPDGIRMVSIVESCSCMSCMSTNYDQFTEAMRGHVQDAVATGTATRH
jgi:hypothetical protein